MEKKDRWDHHLIYKKIAPSSSVLDLGCGNGELLSQLVNKKYVYGQAVEADPNKVAEAICSGVAVYQKDMDLGLPEFMDNAFDYVILEKTLQALYRPLVVMKEMLRIGKSCIVTFPNFNYREIIGKLMDTGRMPVTGSLPYQWYETPNIHLFTLYDFLDWVVQNGVNIIDSYAWKAGSCSHLKLPEDSTEAEELLFVIEQAC